jgi:Toxin SymE, type I toxin-antitoxin system
MRNKHSCVPALRLNGEWLGRFGFTPGQKVRLKIGPGKILITVTSPAVPSVEGEKTATP